MKYRSGRPLSEEDEEEFGARPIESEDDDEFESESDEHRFDEEKHVPETKYPSRGRSKPQVSIEVIDLREEPSFEILTDLAKMEDESPKGMGKASRAMEDEMRNKMFLESEAQKKIDKIKLKQAKRELDTQTPGGRQRETKRQDREQDARERRLSEVQGKGLSDALIGSPIKGIGKILARIASGEDIDISSLLSEGKQAVGDIVETGKYYTDSDDITEERSLMESLDRMDPDIGEDLGRYDKLMRDLDDDKFADSEAGDEAIAELDDIIKRVRATVEKRRD